MIDLTKLRKIYHGGGGEVVALDDLTLSIPEGLSVLSGPSGCGKSTLINLIGALDKPTSGTIHVAGEEITGFSELDVDRYRRETVGIVFQFFHLMPTLSVLENVALPAELAGHSTSWARKRASQLLERVDLHERIRHRPHELSGGETQRTAIARALINQPRIVLADEPTGNLDSSSSEKVMDIFARLIHDEGVSAIVATHDPDVVSRSNRIFKMHDGQIVNVENLQASSSNAAHHVSSTSGS